jgi:Fur family peroxide stress response transcriptional regulator
MRLLFAYLSQIGGILKVQAGELARRVERFKASVKAAGVKLTHQRLEIFREVAASLGHPDAEAVFRAVQPRMPTVSLDTVYRTLWLLSDLGVVRPLGPRRESVRFDANLEDHHHYVCVRCGLTRDFRSAGMGGLPVPQAARGFGSVLATHVEVRGICAGCASRATEKPRPGKRKPMQGRRRA